MTRKEAINRVKGYLTDIIPIEGYSEVDEIIKALEQEPCEDYISRQAVVELVEGWWIGHTKEDDLSTEIQKLPSVNPQKPKKGHWIADVDKWCDIVTTVNGYRCNKCNTFNADKDNYCPNCGAKMVEPQESEDKE